MLETIQEFVGNYDINLNEIISSVLSGTKTALLFFAILLIGLFVAGIIKKLLRKALNVIKIDQNLEKIGVKEEMKSAGLNINFSDLIAMIVGIFLKLIVWMAAIEVLKIPALSTFMKDVISYMPNVLVAVIILIAGAAVAKAVQGIILEAFKGVDKKNAERGATAAKVGILAFSFMAALTQIEVASELVETLFAAIVNGLSYGFALAFGIAVGMGGKDKVADCINKMK